MDQTTQCALETKLKSIFGENCCIRRCRSVSGGSISRSFHLEIEGDTYVRDVFIKLNNVSKYSLFTAEETSLTALANTNTVRVPKALFTGCTQQHSFIAMEYFDLKPLDITAAVILGEQMAHLHQHQDHHQNQNLYGFKQDNFIGLTPQSNHSESDWSVFIKKQRLGFQLELALRRGLDNKLVKVVETIIDHVEIIFDNYAPASSLLHGDLWAGNAAMTADGEPVIYDPACYYGDRETDIAMTELFGSYPLEFYQSYNRLLPMADGYQIRKHVYNLYHLMNHYNLFGPSYESRLMTESQQIIAQL